jgi:hypothetical protein
MRSVWIIPIVVVLIVGGIFMYSRRDPCAIDQPPVFIGTHVYPMWIQPVITNNTTILIPHPARRVYRYQGHRLRGGEECVVETSHLREES